MVVVYLFGCLLGSTGIANAQNYSRFDLSTSYSYVHGSPEHTSGISAGIGSLGLNGGSISLGYNAKSWLAAVTDVSGYAGNSVILDCVLSGCPSALSHSSTMWTFLAGPRINFRHSKRVTPYVQALAGFAHGSNIYVPGIQKAFAASVGGGLDVRVTDHFSLRPVQVDYLLTRFNEFTDGRAEQHDVRISSGLAVHF